MSELEYLDIPKMVALFGPMAEVHGLIGNIIIDMFKEDELWEDWVLFYQRTYLIWLTQEKICNLFVENPK